MPISDDCVGRGDGTNRGAFGTDQRQPARGERQREHGGAEFSERGALCDGERLQMAAVAGALRQLAYDLHTHEPVEQKRGVGPGLRQAATGGSATA